jgi:hypothetical protein
LAGLLFLVDVGARRLRVGALDFAQAWRRILGWWGTRGRPVAQPAATRLLAAKQRLNGTTPFQPRASSTGPSTPTVIGRVRARTEPGPTQPAEPPAAAAIGMRLMAAKKRAAKDK